MNLRLLIMGVLTFLMSFFSSCKKESKEQLKSFTDRVTGNYTDVTWSEVLEGKREQVDIHFKEGEIDLGTIAEMSTKSKLQSKTTTVVIADLLVNTNLKIETKPVRVKFRLVKRIPKYLKSKKERQPYEERALKEIQNSYHKLQSPLNFRYTMDADSYKNMDDTYVLKASKL